MPDVDLGQFVRESDRDRYLSALFAEADLREQLFALYAFNAEIAMVRDRVSTPMLGEVRFQWWRDVLEGSRTGEAQNHPAASALLTTIAAARLPISPLLSLIDARTFDLYDDPMPTVGDLERYAGETSSILIRLASFVIGRGTDLGGADAAGHGGVAFALAGLLRSFPRHAAAGRVYIPTEIMARRGVDRADLLAGRLSPELADALGDMRALARKHLAAARAATLAADLAPAFLPLALVEPYLRCAERPGFDPFREAVDIAPWRRQLVLWRAAVFGI